MNIQEWLDSTNPEEMKSSLIQRGINDSRKLRLFSVACCRRIWFLLADERSRLAVEVAERFCDGGATNEERKAAALATPPGDYLSSFGLAARAAYLTIDERAFPSASGTTAKAVAWGCTTREAAITARHAEFVAQAELLRDLYGNPFRSTLVDPKWMTTDITSLAATIYDERRFDLMPHLSDALKKAGCADNEILIHCQTRQDHAKGCWVIDALLGKV
jgi:hypothetical protein